MKWTKLTVETTCEAVDLLNAFLDEEGVLGVQIVTIRMPKIQKNLERFQKMAQWATRKSQLIAWTKKQQKRLKRDKKEK